MENKRERSLNFSRSECECLVTLIEKYKDILECKKTDATTWKKKEVTWSRVANELNAVYATGRTAKMLRAKYDNLKKLAKKDYAQAKTEAMQTGAGLPVDRKPDELLERVKALICLPSSSLPPRYETGRHNSSTTMWDGWNPSIVKNPIHPELRVPDVVDDGGEIVVDETTPDPETPSDPCAGPSHAILTEEQREMRKRPRTVYTTDETGGLYNELSLDKNHLGSFQNELLELEKFKINEEREFKRQEHNKRMKQMDEEWEFKREEHKKRLKQMDEEREFKREEHNKRMKQMDEEREFKIEEHEFAREDHQKRMLLFDLEISKIT